MAVLFAGEGNHQIEKQKAFIGRQSDLEDAVARPKISAFAQAGYGRPGLNFLDNGFEPFLQVGVRGQWNLSSLYHRKNEIKSKRKF